MKIAATSLPTAGATTRRAHVCMNALLSRTTIALFATALLVAASTPARAWDERDWSNRNSRYDDFQTWADGQLVDVQLRVDGVAAPLYMANGRFDRHYFQAFAGRNYSVVLRNNTGRRMAVLLAVDGLNALNGEITTLKPREPMYVLGPWEQATIRGWRTSLDEVRRFVFVDEQRSYAERTNQANSDMGWIRVLSFRESLPWWQTRQNGWGQVRGLYRGDGPSSSVPIPAPVPEEAPQARAQDSKDEAPGLAKSAAPERGKASVEQQDNLARGEQPNGGSFPGTGWGDRTQDHVTRVQFRPESVAVDRLIFRYEYASGLQALGIVPARSRWHDRLGERDGDMGFAKPPQR